MSLCALTILTLADASQALPNLDALYTGAVPGDEEQGAGETSDPVLPIAVVAPLVQKQRGAPAG
jgi:hypothetical protein